MEKQSRVLDSRNRRFQHTFAQDTPGMLPPKAIAAERIAGSDANETWLIIAPQSCNIPMTGPAAHPPERHWSRHHEAHQQLELEIRIVAGRCNEFLTADLAEKSSR